MKYFSTFLSFLCAVSLFLSIALGLAASADESARGWELLESAFLFVAIAGCLGVGSMATRRFARLHRRRVARQLDREFLRRNKL